MASSRVHHIKWARDFINKFMQLWKSGHETYIEVETNDGKANEVLHLQLGPDHGHGHKQRSLFTRARHYPAIERR